MMLMQRIPYLIALLACVSLVTAVGLACSSQDESGEPAAEENDDEQTEMLNQVVVRNHMAQAIHEIHVRLAYDETDEFSENVLGVESIEPNGETTFALHAGSFDVRAQLADGTFVVLEGVDADEIVFEQMEATLPGDALATLLVRNELDVAIVELHVRFQENRERGDAAFSTNILEVDSIEPGEELYFYWGPGPLDLRAVLADGTSMIVEFDDRNGTITFAPQ